MTRPSRTGGKTSAAKARNASPAKGRKTTKTKRRIAPAATRVKRRSVSGPSKDLKEAREQQAATAEILKVIASSPNDVQPVFDAIVANADRLISGFTTGVYRFVDDIIHLAAITSVSPDADEALKAQFPRPAGDAKHFRMALAGEVWAVADTEAQPDKPLKDIARVRGYPERVVLAPDEQWKIDWRHRRQPPQRRSIFSASRSAASNLRRPGRHRHREHAAVQRGPPAHRRSE